MSNVHCQLAIDEISVVMYVLLYGIVHMHFYEGGSKVHRVQITYGSNVD